ncbi:hypothetical protein BgAZ_202100 [Babesia gibsoni]|uniref:J domain-containing protein n=1 Tax=Babesia gibsoni TaxID=33632 RepID=A0AAD8LM11_BABGI|nr:hypothetical protein BgAZ_202100 [Babesia gibsoni]
MKNYYAILDIAKNATRKEIRTAYLKKAKMYHPDLNSSPNAAVRFKEVQEAYNTLYDPDKRQNYDSQNAFGSFGRSNARASATYGGTNYRNTGYNAHHESASSFEDHFRAEAEQLRRQWQEMETDKLRATERFKKNFSGNDFGGMRMFYFFPSYKLRYLLYFLNRIAPLIFIPLAFLCFFTTEVMGAPTKQRAKIHIVYDSYGRAYAFDMYGRRYRMPEFDKR